MRTVRASFLALAALFLGPPAFAQQNRFEPNQTRRTAAKVQAGDHRGVLCNEEDWFFVDATRGQRVEVSVRFEHQGGDLDLELYDRTGRLLAWSRGQRDDEAIAYAPPADMPVFMRVYNAGNRYDLHVGLTPTAYAGAGAVQDVSCWGSDWYPIDVPAGREVRVDLTFRHADGDLDLALVDEAGNELAVSTGQGDAETARFSCAEAKTVLIHVWNVARARSPYSMRVVIGEAVPEDLDRVFRVERLAGAGQDILVLRNGDQLRGTVLNETFEIHTPYTDLVIPARRVAGIDVERNRTDVETLVAVNNNRFSGFLRTRSIVFRLPGLDQPVEIRRERLTRVIFGKRGNERAGLAQHQYVVLRNGDHFSARLLSTGWVLDMGFASLPVRTDQLQSLTFEHRTGEVSLLRLDESTLRGRLAAEDVELELDITAADAQARGHPSVIHRDRIEALYLPDGFVPDRLLPTGRLLTFDFEDGIEPWVAQGNWNTTWMHWPREGVRGEGCARACGPNGTNYGDNAHVTLTSPPLSLGNMGRPIIRLQVKTRLERGPDFFILRVSYDGGVSFQEVHRLTGDNEWTQVEAPLQPRQQGEVVIQLALVTDGSIVNLGLWIDALEIVDGGDER